MDTEDNWQSPPNLARHAGTSLSTSNGQQLCSAAPISTSTLDPVHTRPLTSNFRLERPQWCPAKLLGAPVRVRSAAPGTESRHRRTAAKLAWRHLCAVARGRGVRK